MNGTRRPARRVFQKLGLHPEVAERKLPAALFWMDVDLRPEPLADAQEVVRRRRRSLRVDVCRVPRSTPDSARRRVPRSLSYQGGGAAPAPKVP